MIFFFLLIQSLLKLLTPPKPYSWQTIILISLFLIILSTSISGTLQTALLFISWIFLIIGVAWSTTENPIVVNGIRLNHWITGALVSIFLFGGLRNKFNPTSWVSWPTISGIIATLSELNRLSFNFKMLPSVTRQKMVIFLLIHIMVSCWIQFYFIIQNWIQAYPSTLADNFDKSGFVVKIEWASVPVSRGSLILEGIEPNLKKNLDKKTWSEAEKWLLDAKTKISKLEKEMIKKLPPLAENSFWDFQTNVSWENPGYNLQLLATWRGPSSYSDGYVLKKSCQILPTQRIEVSTRGTSQSKIVPITVASPTSLSQVKCGPVKQVIPKQQKV